MKNVESQEESYHCTACNNYISAEHGGDYCCDMLLCCDEDCLAIHKHQHHKIEKPSLFSKKNDVIN